MSKYSPRALLAVSLAAALIGAALYERGLPAAADFSADDATTTTALDPHRPQCDWTPPVTAETRIADTADKILSLVASAAPGTTILIEDGEYQLPRTIEVTTPDVVIRSRGGDRAKVILRGAGMGERAVGVAVAIGASRVTIADLTLGYVGYHALQVRGERNVSDITLQNLRL